MVMANAPVKLVQYGKQLSMSIDQNFWSLTSVWTYSRLIDLVKHYFKDQFNFLQAYKKLTSLCKKAVEEVYILIKRDRKVFSDLARNREWSPVLSKKNRGIVNSLWYSIVILCSDEARHGVTSLYWPCFFISHSKWWVETS